MASEAACVHCGLPLRRQPTRDDEAYCCSGCWVADHLAGSGEGAGSDRLLARLVVSVFLSMGVMVFSLSLYGEDWGRAAGATEGEGVEALRGLGRLGAGVMSMPVFVLLGLPLLEAVVRMRRWLSAESLVLAGVASALAVSMWNTATESGAVYYETATGVLVLVTLGRWLESSAKHRAAKELHSLMPDRIEDVVRIDDEGESEVDPAELRAGDLVRTRPGDAFAVDGVVVEGRSLVDTALLTGEEQPVPVQPGDEVFAGTMPTDGALVVRVRATGRDRACVRVDALLSESLAGRSGAGRLADRVSAVLLPAVLVIAAWTVWSRLGVVGVEQALLDGLSVILISCPCALGIATPLAFWVAMGSAWRRGVLVRGADVLERLASVRRVFLDKTGTLTTGECTVVEVLLKDEAWDQDRVLRVAASLEAGSRHPIARALRRSATERTLDLAPLTDFRLLPGIGVEGTVDGIAVRLTRSGDSHTDDERSWVQLECDHEAVAEIALATEVRSESEHVVRELEQLGLAPSVLTGDGPGPAEALSKQLGLPVLHSLAPDDKLEHVRAAGEHSLFIGDGWNDAPALGAASVGVSVAGGVGRSLERASINLIRPGLAIVPDVVRLARRATSVARWNLVWAFSYNAVGLVLAAQGKLSPILAALMMVGSSLAVTLHARRASSWR